MINPKAEIKKSSDISKLIQDNLSTEDKKINEPDKFDNNIDNLKDQLIIGNHSKNENKENSKLNSTKKLLIIWIIFILVLVLIMIIITIAKPEDEEIALDYEEAEKLIDSKLTNENHKLLDESIINIDELQLIFNNMIFSRINKSVDQIPENLDFLINTNESYFLVAKDDLDLYNSTYDILTLQTNSFTVESPEYFINLTPSIKNFKSKIDILTNQYEQTIKKIAIPFAKYKNKTTQKLRVLQLDDLITQYRNEIENLNKFYNRFLKNIKDIAINFFLSVNTFNNGVKDLINKVISGISEFKRILGLMTKEKIHENLKLLKELFISFKKDIDNLKSGFDEIEKKIQELEENLDKNLDINIYINIIKNLNNIITILKKSENFVMSNITAYSLNDETIKNSISDFFSVFEKVKEDIKFLSETANVEISTSLDLLFIIDITGSMRHYLEEVKNNILSIINGIIEKCPGIDINLGFIGYRDFGEEYTNIDFTKDHNYVKKIISNIKTSGGGDIPEDVAFAFELALNKTWKSNAKFAIFIADAPAHGEQYGGDDYKESYPKRRPLEDMIIEMEENDISLFCLRISKQTDIMYKLFEDIYDSRKSINTKFIIVDNNEDKVLKASSTTFSDYVVLNAINLYYTIKLDKGCLIDKNTAINTLKTNYDIKNSHPDENLRFILGRCSPVLLVPGIYSTKMVVEFNCKGIAKDEKSTTLKNIRIHCGDLVCKDETKIKEEHRLFFSLKDNAFSILKDSNDKYGACLGHISNYFQNENECQKVNGKNICFYSKYIKVAYYGGTSDTLKDSRCGIEGIIDVVEGKWNAPNFAVNRGAAAVFNKISSNLVKLGYRDGFSLAGLPNDFRRYLATNNFATNVFKSQINRLYKNTGKQVIIIGHSYGTLLSLTNLLKNQNDKEFMKKIKKFIALAPPFAGSGELLKTFLQASKEFDASKLWINAQFKIFGQYLMYKSLPTVMELRPQSISSRIFMDSSYAELSDALRGRLDIERDCKKRDCDISEIKKKTSSFDNLFKGYFPSLLDPECSYESNIGGNNEVINRKCYTSIYNVGDCPSMITKSVDPNEDNFENDFYCNKFGKTYFYQGECDDEKRNCLDKMFYSNKCPNVYNDKEAVNFLINRFNDKFSKIYGNISQSYFDSYENIKNGVEKSIEHQKKISLINDLPIPPVDTELIYTSFYPTIASLVVDDDDFTKEGIIYNKGGDGTVPTWSSLLTGLKWIYEKKKNNLSQKIKLIEYCSRLAKSGQYKYDPNKNQNFAAIGCVCIEEKSNVYIDNKDKKIDKCSHGQMLSDDYLNSYIISVIEKESISVTNSKKNAVKNYNPKNDFIGECNNDIYKILNTVK